MICKGFQSHEKEKINVLWLRRKNWGQDVSEKFSSSKKKWKLRLLWLQVIASRLEEMNITKQVVGNRAGFRTIIIWVKCLPQKGPNVSTEERLRISQRPKDIWKKKKRQGKQLEE